MTWTPASFGSPAWFGSYAKAKSQINGTFSGPGVTMTRRMNAGVESERALTYGTQENGDRPEFFDGEGLKWSEIAGLATGEIRSPAGYERKTPTHKHACFHFLLQ